MAFIANNIAVLHLSLSRLTVSDVPRRLPTWAPIEFYAAFAAMDSVHNCMSFLSSTECHLHGWRLFSSSQRQDDGEFVQFVTGFEPLLIKGDAVAYARPATERFSLMAGWEVPDVRFSPPRELLDYLSRKK